MIRDSAGVTIVENRLADVPPLDWRISAEPAVRIGVLDGPTEYQLSRVIGATRLPDGRIVIADGGSGEVRLYGAGGEHLYSVGGAGDGPGEFRSMQRFHRFAGDSLLLWDSRDFRLSVFDGDGRYVRAFRLDASEDGRFVFPTIPLGDGSMLGTEGVGLPPDLEGVWRPNARYLRYTMDGALLDTVGEFPAIERYVVQRDRGASASPLGFGKATRIAARNGAIVVGRQETYELERFDAAGSLERRIRVTRPQRPVTAADVAALRRQRLAALDDEEQRRAEQRLLDAMTFPEAMPAYGEVLVDEDGFLWVEEYRAPGENLFAWNVFDPDGRLLGRIETPVGLEIREIGAGYILGIWKDELDVEYVHLHTLVRA